jgi:transcriptional regulator with XRE-family HTH domain
MSNLRICPRCGGSGTVLDDKKMGAFMRSIRIKSGLSGRELARRMGVSAAYLSDLELGRRGWNEERRAKYRKATEAKP